MFKFIYYRYILLIELRFKGLLYRSRKYIKKKNSKDLTFQIIWTWKQFLFFKWGYQRHKIQEQD